jgi:DNA-binding NtrC family response regulator
MVIHCRGVALVGGLPKWRSRMALALGARDVKVWQARNLSEALPVLLHEPVDVVLVSITEIESAPELFQTLSQQRLRQHPRIVVTFPGALSVDRMKLAYDMHTDHCETEPHHPSRLISLLEQVERQPRRWVRDEPDGKEQIGVCKQAKNPDSRG